MIAIFASLAPRFAQVEAVMTRSLASDEPRIQQLIEQLGSFHGKMLRPALVLLVAEAVGTVTADHVRLGAALELIHTATLIHDDMIDEASRKMALVISAKGASSCGGRNCPPYAPKNPVSSGTT